MRGKVTLQEIADSVGLSKYAVSRALAGKSGVSAHSRELILKKAAELGYRREQPAASPAPVVKLTDTELRAWSGTVLVLFPDVRSQNKESAYWGPLFEGIMDGLNRKGIHIVTLTKPDINSMFSLLNPSAIMGIITLGSISSTVLHEARRLGIPVVMVDHLDDTFDCDTLFSDNVVGMREIMSTMLGKGYRHYQFVGNIGEAFSYYERWLGFHASLTGAGIVCDPIPSLLDHDLGSLRLQLGEIFAARPLPEVFVCANDFYADFTLRTLRELGLSTEGVVFTGFDNKLPDVVYATINVEENRIGGRAVDQLLWRILNPDASFERKLVRGTLVVNG